MKAVWLLAVVGSLLSVPVPGFGATVLGRMTLTLSPVNGGGSYVIEIRQEGGRILGHTSFGPNSMVNLSVGHGSYTGMAGGDGFTSLKCGAEGCDGTIGGRSVNFKVEGAYKLEGAMNFHPLRANKTKDAISVYAQGSLELARTADGSYSGTGFLSADPMSQVSAELKTEGSLKDLEDAGLIAIFLARPLAGR